MGQLTRDQILETALLQGGMNSSLKSRLVLPFAAALRSLYKSWPWPFLRVREVDVALTAGAESVRIGVGSGGVTREIQEILSPIFIYTADRSTKAVIHIQERVGNALTTWDETLNDTSAWRGLPKRAKVQIAGLWGRWDIIPLPFPDKDYLLAVDYLEQPADMNDLSESFAASIPIYPSDRTLIKIAMTEALLDQHGIDHPKYQAAAEEAGAAVTIDRQRYGSVYGDNDRIVLDPSTFK